jgi:UTP:GlnB (protein PII) uridylyltransferase
MLFSETTEFDDIIYVGALFHDIGKGIEPHEETGLLNPLPKD